MDKKAKKRYQVLRQKLATLQPQLSGAKQQQDDPEEIPRRSEELDVHLLSLNGELLPYRVRVVTDDPFPIQDYWRWEQQQRLDWRFEPFDR